MNFLRGILPGEPSLHRRNGVTIAANGEHSKNDNGGDDYPTDQQVIDDENAVYSNGTTARIRTEAERKLLHTLSTTEALRERHDKVLLLEQYLRNHAGYSKLFHDNPERTAITDDDTLSLNILVMHKVCFVPLCLIVHCPIRLTGPIPLTS